MDVEVIIGDVFFNGANLKPANLFRPKNAVPLTLILWGQTWQHN